MNRFIIPILLLTLLIGSTGRLTNPALAQDVSSVTPLPMPEVTPPQAPDGAQETFDTGANQLLASILEISRFVGGGINQLLASSHTTQVMLTNIRNSVSGQKTFPVLNNPADVSAREGGPGLLEMAQSTLNGEAVGPATLRETLDRFRANYRLDGPFSQRDTPLLSNIVIANATAQGAVAAATAEDSYKRANVGMGHINGYIAALSASNDLKTSVDINTRVMIEVAQQLNETLRNQAALTSVAGTYLMALGAEAGETDTFRLDNWNR